MRDKLIEALENTDDLGYLKNKKVGDFILSTEKVHGGCEGSGEEHWIVLKVEHDGKTSFWEIPGWYQSYEGAELEIENIFEVVQKEVVVTVWEKK